MLARKWRPCNFSQVAGQSHVLKSLINALDNQRLHHAYLFTGTRGVGKTTLARILAKCLNCEEGISSVPCEQCASCQEINEGRFIDLIEVDAASRTKVEDTRELLENVQYAPGRGRFKVYLIDEVHMLSNHSFNALLKTLEEPPEHVKFLFATTDPQKLPVTILSRCLQFNLKNLSPKLIVDYLQSVLQEEKIKNDKDALWQIAAAAAGSMRDALTLVDQAISYCQGEVAKAGVIEMLGVPEHQQVFAVLDGMASGNIHNVLNLINEVSEKTPDYAHTLDSILSCLHRIAIAQAAPGTLDNSFGDKEQLQALANKFSAEDIQLFYQIGVEGRKDLKAGIDMRSAFEMLLIRMMLFSPSLVSDDLKAGLPGEEITEPEATDTVKKKSIITEPVIEPADLYESASDALGQSEAGSIDVSGSEEQVSLDGSIQGDEANQQLEAAEDKATAQGSGNEDATGVELATGSPETILQTLDHSGWLKLFPALPSTGIAANVFANSEFLGFADGVLQFRLDESQSAVYSEEIIPKLETLVSRFFDRELKVSIEITAADKETPALLAAREKAEAHSKMVEQFEQDDNVQQLVNRFSGSITMDSITSRDGQGKL